MGMGVAASPAPPLTARLASCEKKNHSLRSIAIRPISLRVSGGSSDQYCAMQTLTICGILIFVLGVLNYISAGFFNSTENREIRFYFCDFFGRIQSCGAVFG